MTTPPRLVASYGATPQNRQDAQNVYQSVIAELDTVRAMADNWRKGIAGLLVAVIGFSLIRGRTDLDRLDQRWAIAVAALLAATLIIGGFAAYRILGAAYGRPKAVPLLPGPRFDGRTRTPTTRHDLALASLAALRQGILAATGAVAALATAVAITWFGPPREGPQLSVTDSAGASWCGTVKESGPGTAVLATAAGTVRIRLDTVMYIRSVATCPRTN
ncbi:hypothetical protein [Nocardia noduli]|uniref:hypothetical protein n=1 Tax=Nocardia noduli TaxID=2815722 RepID=UPI001C214442|nr:hypothetical protein [Nocardia noduli]